MTAAKTAYPASLPRRPWNFDLLFDAAKKHTVIRLRWPLVILSSYLLYYAPSPWLTDTQLQAILILYLLSHSTLYFLADELFDSPYFYGPLLIFDSLVLIAVLSTTGTTSPDFYIACLFTIIISCICNDTRGLLAVTFLAPLAYGYFVFHTAQDLTPNLYLRLPFPFVISLFYGYFAQVERIRASARAKEQEAERQQQAAEEIRRQRERLEVLHELNLAINSTIDTDKLLASFLSTALTHLPYAAAVIRLKNRATGQLEICGARGLRDNGLKQGAAVWSLVDSVVSDRRVLRVSNVFSQTPGNNLEFFRSEGLVAFLAVPLLAGNEALGCLVFLTREQHEFGEEEISFVTTLAGQAAIAMHHAELYEHSRRQADALRGAHKIKDEFLRAVSSRLKTPLNVIAGYADMFREGLLGELTPIQEKAIETVARQAKDLHGLINTVLQVSNIETEPLQLQLHELNLWEFLSDMRARFDAPMGSDVKIVWDCPFECPTLQADRRKLGQILENLIDNALKYTVLGAVTISVRYLLSAKMLDIKVSDTGRGIASERLPNLFDRFNPIDDGVADSEQAGVGLGLYVVKKYVELLGGKIAVESRVGHGSTFSLRIPAAVQSTPVLHEQLLLPTEPATFAASPR